MYDTVKLLAHTIPVLEDIENFNTGQFIAYCAKISNPNSQANTLNMEKLLKYLMEHKHWSPFEMANMVLEITTTRDITRQIIRHRSFSFQEFSQRYAKVEGSAYVVREFRLQDANNRQNSITVEDMSEEQLLVQEEWIRRQVAIIEAAEGTYNWAIDNGVAKEQARVILPEGNTLSTLIMNGTMRSWMHYADLRDGNGTQKEHISIAKKVKDIIKELMREKISRVDELNQLNIALGAE